MCTVSSGACTLTSTLDPLTKPWNCMQIGLALEAHIWGRHDRRLREEVRHARITKTASHADAWHRPLPSKSELAPKLPGP